ncbi:DUF4198 domain-containing protein [Suttonella ornithocola]|uniref:Nickel uptake substrate-specific transmembrane region n=1 Tax=Suttonella ornithocola TaxID=279832 RepID=A0A380MPV3_9GAMM|nr:DUF4198 domain-containing protein [Suttonella ornithocola]SUO94204.1 Nickel uptake substrate-specific transmembrane region [Suttonella ornithocola]
MKKYLSIALIAACSTTAFAHSLWVIGDNNKDTVSVNLIYGHDFPEPEIIPEERLSIFEAPVIHGENFKEVLKQAGAENYHYEGKAKLKEGTYLLSAYYQPTSWVKDDAGKWYMNKTRKDIKNAVLCETAVMQGKSILTVGNDDGSYAQTVLGKGIEITPLANSNALKVDATIPFRLTKNGEPVADAVILGSYDGYGFSGHDIPMPFYAKTNKKGEFEFKALKPGLWYLTTELEEDSGNADCEIDFTEVTLTFEVK